METLQEKRLEFLNETVGFYTNNPRSITETGECIYSPTSKSVGCAIGRHIEDKDLCKQLDNHRSGGLAATEIFYTFDLLPEKLKALGKDFLQDVQDLHDCDVYWANTDLHSINFNLPSSSKVGLSVSGKEKYRTIVKFYCKDNETD